MNIIMPFILPYDQFERHYVVSKLLKKNDIKTILDVGGRNGLLKKFIQKKIITLNVDGTGDVEYDGKTMPFDDNSFSAVISLDTIEHIPKEKRTDFLRECKRVSRKYVMITGPYGTEAHIECEIRLNKLYTEIYGKPHPYLNEHIKYGIPTANEIETIIKNLDIQNYTIYYAGDFLWQCKNFERILKSKGKGIINKFFGYLFKFYTLAIFHRIKLSSLSYEKANRFYLCCQCN